MEFNIKNDVVNITEKEFEFSRETIEKYLAHKSRVSGFLKKLQTEIIESSKEFTDKKLVKIILRCPYPKEDLNYLLIDIDFIGIDESIQSQGIGYKFLESAISILFKNEVDCIRIVASDKFGTDSEKLYALYESLGFWQIPNGYKGDMYYINPSLNNNDMKWKITMDLSHLSMNKIFDFSSLQSFSR